ncbi:Uncharacterised protein [Vibrio cholerae]|nr:Uncharacterised protein [Vibrio cholerae]
MLGGMKVAHSTATSSSKGIAIIRRRIRPH